MDANKGTELALATLIAIILAALGIWKGHPVITTILLSAGFGFCIFIVLRSLISGFLPRNKIVRNAILAASAVTTAALFGWWLWPVQPIIVVVTFKDSAVFTRAREVRITKILDAYYRYLTEQVGFSLPRELPPLGVSPVGGPVIAGGESQTPYYYSDIFIPQDAVDRPNVVRMAYSAYAFRRLFDLAPRAPTNDPRRKLYSAASSIYACYYRSSFVGRDLCSGPGYVEHPWIVGLWAVRQKFGQAYTDKLLYYTLKEWPDSPPITGSFDDVFMRKIEWAEVVLNNPGPQFASLRETLRAKGVALR